MKQILDNIFYDSSVKRIQEVFLLCYLCISTISNILYFFKLTLTSTLTNLIKITKIKKQLIGIQLVANFTM